jgi:hypothetical protein
MIRLLVRLRVQVSAAGFLAALVLLLIVTPFVRGFREGQIYEAVLFTLVMCTGLIASGSWRRIRGLAFALASLALTSMWVNQVWPQKCTALTFILLAMAFLVLVITSLSRFILRAKQVNADVLCAGISVYLILGLLWGLAYTLVAQLIPNAFSFSTRAGTSATMSGFTSIYFSFITLATLGYGDVIPVADVARMLAMLEAMTGTFFVAILIARLVSLYSASWQTHAPLHDEGGSNCK